MNRVATTSAEFTMAELHALKGTLSRGQHSEIPAGRAPNIIIGVAILIAAELMFFGGLVTAFLVLRAGALFWPPPGQPRLPVAATGLNTIVLLASGCGMHSALKELRCGDLAKFQRRLMLAVTLGTLFVLAQGCEWVRLMISGLRLTAGFYGALFTAIVGAHAIHLIGGLLAMGMVMMKAGRGRYTARRIAGVEACAIYWTFVVLLWPGLYVVVFLT
jgi:cytochrome c oxidase subunit III